MAFVEIESKLEGNDTFKYKMKGILSKNKLTYEEGDSIITLKIEDTIFLHKKRKDGTNLKFHFKEGEETNLLIESESVTLPISLYTKQIKKEDKKIQIKYKLGLDDFTYTIFWRV